MGTIWVKEFVGGLDTRRMAETTSGGVLIRAKDGHINRGGEFEKRAAFVEEYELPTGTVGMAAGASSIVVFGHATTPSGIPTGVTYQRLQHPSGTALSRVLSYDLYAGKVYAVGEFTDGSVYHFYDGTRVTDWYDGRARASFSVVSGIGTGAAQATGSFEVTGGTLSAGVNKISDIKIDGVSIISAAVDHTGNNSTTASAIATAINSYSSSPEYSASANGQTVTITADAAGSAPNGKTIVITVGGNATTANVVNMAGGVNGATATLSSIKVSGVEILNGAVSWSTSNSVTAADIASSINTKVSSPEYTATSSGDTVNIVASTAGTDANGRVVAFTTADGFVVSPTSLTMEGGSTASGTYTPGTFVKTIGSRMHSVSGPNEHFSGIKQPTKWTTDATGAGAIDMSTQAAGAENLTAVAIYQQYVAVFAERVTQIWYFDSDPSLNSLKQVLNNTGTESPNSVTQFGDNDLFYVDESGVRSLRARDSSNAAATMDIGVPIDTLVVEKLRTMSDAERQKIVGLIEPRDGRFWLCMIDEVFVFSFFSGAKISAWSSYVPSFQNEDDEQEEFDIDNACVFQRKVHVRSGNKIYVYGSLEDDIAYDNTEAEAWLPYLDAEAPTEIKLLTGIDIACEGEWEVRVGMQPTDEDVSDKIGTVFRTTYNNARIPGGGSFSHISLRFKSKKSTAARVSSCVIHYDKGENAA